MATRQLATWVSSLRFSDLPESVVEAAVRSFVNSLGCIIGGSSHETVQRVVRATQDTGQGHCTCLGQSSIDRESAENKRTMRSLDDAVLINGIASHVHDYDDTHLRTVIHPAGAIVVSLLAFVEHLKHTTQRETSGEEFTTALIVGIETSLRLGNSVSPNHYSAGWHITGTVSPLGVAAALSNLLRVDVSTTTAALGLASTQPVGLRVHFGTDTKAFHVGRAAQIGVQAVKLAQEGFTAAKDALEGRRGWVEILGHGADSLNKEIEELIALTEQSRSSLTKPGTSANPWQIEKNTFKPFPCGIVIHPIIDACIQARDQHGFGTNDKIRDIEQVSLKVNPLVLDLTGKKTPKDGLEAKFSVYHGAAVGLLFGSATPREYNDEVVVDPKVVQLRDKVTAEADQSVRSDEAFLRVLMEGGEEIALHVEHAVGSLDRPMTQDELRKKFSDQVEPVHGQRGILEVERLAWKLPALDDVTAVVNAAV